MNFIFTIKFIKIALVSAVLFVLLDFLWLGVVASPWYRKALGYLSNLDADGKITFNIPHGLMAQLVISLTLTLVIMLGLQLENRFLTSLRLGAFVGFAFYVCYDFTNLSFVKGWPLWISLVDVAWGTVQGVCAACYVYFLSRYL